MDIAGAFSRGIARSQRVLFRPFDFGAWFSFGFVFLLAGLIDPIADWNGKLQVPDFNKTSSSSGPTTLPDPSDIPTEVHDFFDLHGATIGASVATILVTSIVLGIVLTWVGCRGLMMSYRSMSIGYVGIGEAWRETAKPANALFRFHMLVGGIGAVLGLPPLVIAGRMIVASYASGQRDLHALVRIAIPFLLLVGVVALVWGTLLFVGRQLLAPVLLFFSCGLREGCNRVFQIVGQDPAGVALFVLARILLAVVLGVLSSFLSTITCCIGGLPLLHQAILAPALAFDRAFTLHALASLGPEYAKMAPDLPPPMSPTLWRR